MCKQLTGKKETVPAGDVPGMIASTDHPLMEGFISTGATVSTTVPGVAERAADQHDTGQQGNVHPVLNAASSKSDFWVQYMSRDDAHAPSDEERAEKAGQLAEEIVKEFRPEGSVGRVSAWTRKRAFAKKKSRYSSTAAENWRKKKQASSAAAPGGAQGNVKNNAYEDPNNLSPEARKKLSDMMHDNIDYMGYIDDDFFLVNFKGAFAKLEAYARIAEGLANRKWNGAEAQTVLGTVQGLKAYKVEDLKEKADSLKTIKEFYEAKMDVLSNPFYLTLKKSDTRKLKEEELLDRSQRLKADKPQLAAYLDAMHRLRKLKNSGTFRKHKHEASLWRSDYQDRYDKNLKAHMSFMNVKADVSFGGSKYGLTIDEDIIEDHEKNKHTGGLSVEVNASANLYEQTFDASSENGLWKANGEVTVMEVKGYVKAGCSIFNSEMVANREAGDKTGDPVNGVDGYFGIEAGVKGSFARGKLGGSFVTKQKWDNIKLFGASVSASGDILSANANAGAKFGKYTENDDNKTEVTGASVMAGVSASALSGTVNGEITIMGVKIGLSATGKLGSVGASVGAAVNAGRIGLSFGGALGAGADFGFYVDASDLLEFAKNKIKAHVRDADYEFVRSMREKKTKAYNWLKSLVSSEEDKLQISGPTVVQVVPVLSREELDREERVGISCDAERQRLAALGPAAVNAAGAYQTPNYVISLEDTKFENGELSKDVSQKPLFGDDRIPLADQVRQRMGLDDCYLMSALAGLAVLNPDYIKNTLIGEDPNNANYVNVKLYDSHGQPEVVRVKKTEWRNDDRPLWIQLVEKAVLAFIQKNSGSTIGGSAAFREARGQNGGWINAAFDDHSIYQNELDMGSETLAWQILFGRAGTQLSLPASDPETADRVLGKALAWSNAGRIVSASTDRIDRRELSPLAQHMRDRHVYTVLGEGKKSDGRRTVKIRDPYADTGENGVFTITFKDFGICFVDVATPG